VVLLLWLVDLPEIEQEFGGGDVSLTLGVRFVLTIPALFMAISAIFSSQIMNLIGKRVSLLASLLIYAIAGVSGGLVDSLSALLITRVALGLATGIMMTTVISLITDYFDGTQRIAALAQQSMYMSIGSIFVAILAGLLASISWRTTFMSYGIAFLLILPVFMFVFDDDIKKTSAEKVPNKKEWVLIIVLSISAFVTMASFYLIPMFVPPLLRQMGYPSPFFAGLIIGLSMFTSATGSYLYNKFRAFGTPKSIHLAALLIMSLAYLLVVFVNGIGLFTLSLMLFGFGMGLILPNLSDWASSVIDQERRGIAIGLITMGLFLGQFMSPLVSDGVVDASGPILSFGLASFALALSTLLLVSAIVVRPYFVKWFKFLADS